MSKGDRVRKFNKEKFNTNYDNIFKKDVLTQKKPATREEEEKMMREFYAEMKEQKIVELSEIVYTAVVDNLVRIDRELEESFYKIPCLGVLEIRYLFLGRYLRIISGKYLFLIFLNY